jgi:CDP-2,3-bis-(O-geranylgeranyl)-sn-glycerol synthase
MNFQWIFETIWLFLPAYFANASPVVLGGGGPIDGGVNWIDGKPLLGSHKTVKGTVLGIAVGTIVGVLQGNSIGGFLQAGGAILGDIVFSFLKRRVDLEPGASFPFVDQLDFIIFAVILSFPVQSTALNQVFAILVLTFPIHYITNFIAYWLRLKKHPW